MHVHNCCFAHENQTYFDVIVVVLVVVALSSLNLIYQLVITKRYGVRATTSEGQNTFAPSLCFA